MFWVFKRTVSMIRYFEYPQHMFWLRNKKTIFGYAHLIKGLLIIMVLTLFILMDYPIHIATMSMELSILQSKGSQVKLS